MPLTSHIIAQMDLTSGFRKLKPKPKINPPNAHRSQIKIGEKWQTRLPKTKCVWPMKINVICTVHVANRKRARTKCTPMLPFHKYPQTWNEINFRAFEITVLFLKELRTQLIDKYSETVNCDNARCKQFFFGFSSYCNTVIWSIYIGIYLPIEFLLLLICILLTTNRVHFLQYISLSMCVSVCPLMMN